MLRLIQFILLLSVFQYGFSQNSSIIKGRITDEKGGTLSGAHIVVLGKSKGIVSDSEGNFEIHGLTSGEYTLQITYMGYLTHEELIKVFGPADVSIVMKEDQHMLPQLYVIGKHDQLFTKVPGSVSFVDKDEMERIKPLSGNEVFRRVPGLNVVDEEGAGLRVNIGIRGLDPDRSRNVLMMEDGVPVSLSPYGEPEMYYTPAMDRMIGVEVLKGSGQILYGPQTVGGVINYITADPPEQEEITLRIQGGEGSYLSALGSYGNTFNNTGLQLNYLHKQADAIGPTRFNVNDFSTKIKFQLSDKSTVGVKLGAYNETSNSTYVGITQPMFEKGGNDYSVLMPNDELDVDRYLMSFSHRVVLSEKVNLQSALYGYTTTRNWRRQDYSYNTYINGNPNPPPSDWTGVVWGDESVPGGAIYLRDRNGNRDRQFEVIGWEQKVNYSFLLGQVQNDLIGGYRFMYEQAHEQRINGSNALAKSGSLVSDEIRTGKAIALYVLDKISLSSKVELTPGLRAEFYSYERDILREGSVDVNKSAENSIQEVIPGIGLTYRPHHRVNLFTGIHRGYAPPRIKDAIDFSVANPVLDLAAEESWNVELGARTQIDKGLYAEFTYFHMDFDNQIIPSSQSVGGSGFGVTNAGRTLHKGVEVAVNWNSREKFNTPWLILLDVNSTYTKATYDSDRFVSNGSESVNVNENRLPYAPELTLSSALALESNNGTGIRFTHTYVGSQFTDELNTVTPSNNGRIGKMSAFNVLDATAYHRINSIGATFNLSVKNLTDERYISTRRPEGIRVGLPRFVTLGFEIKF